MPVKKHKCKQCKLYQDETIRTPAGRFCDIRCAVDFARDKQAANAKKEKKKKEVQKKREFYDSDIKTRKKAAVQACHAYIRERDKNNLCICCGRPLGDKYDAGHFVNAGSSSFLKFHEDNIHAQSVYCNQYRGGDSDDYEGRLRSKIGDERVDYLLENKRRLIKRTAQDYKDIENYYKEKLAKLTDSKL